MDPSYPYSRPRDFLGGNADDDADDYNDPIVGDIDEREVLPLLDGEPTAWFHGAITRKWVADLAENFVCLFEPPHMNGDRMQSSNSIRKHVPMNYNVL